MHHLKWTMSIVPAILMAIGGCGAGNAVTTLPSTPPSTAVKTTSAPPPPVPSSAAAKTSSALPSQAGPNSPSPTGLGEVAWVTADNQLAVLDQVGAKPATWRVAGTPVDPAWSADGRWLAYRTIASGSTGPMWVTNPQGRGHALAAASGKALQVTAFQWSPTGHRLAVIDQSGRLWLAGPTGPATPLSPTDQTVNGLPAWNPQGTAVAYSVIVHPPHSAPVRGEIWRVAVRKPSSDTRWLSQKYTGLEVVRWTAGNALLFWKDPDFSASIASDGVGLYAVTPGGRTHLLTTMLPYAEWVAPNPAGTRVAVIAGKMRIAWHNKALQICDLKTFHCRPVKSGPPGTVALDPTWGAQGLLWVSARDRGNTWGWVTGASSQLSRSAVNARGRQALEAWMATHVLWRANARGQNPRVLSGAGTGVDDPQVSPRGPVVLYVKGGDLWMADTATGNATRIGGPLGLPKADDFGYYGYPDWPSLWTWHS